MTEEKNKNLELRLEGVSDLESFIRKDLKNIEPCLHKINWEYRQLFPSIDIQRGHTIEYLLSEYPYSYSTFDKLRLYADEAKKENKNIFEIIKNTVLDVIEKDKYKVKDYKVNIRDFENVEECYSHYRSEFLNGTGLTESVNKLENNYITGRKEMLKNEK
jgi:hypothetical protein